jgi:U3 small nucleolar RNA-associated protein 19
VWSVVIRWEHSPAIHQQLLVILLEWILPHLDKPLLLTDYFMDSLDMGKLILLSYYHYQALISVDFSFRVTETNQA